MHGLSFNYHNEHTHFCREMCNVVYSIQYTLNTRFWKTFLNFDENNDSAWVRKSSKMGPHLDRILLQRSPFPHCKAVDLASAPSDIISVNASLPSTAEDVYALLLDFSSWITSHIAKFCRERRLCIVMLDITAKLDWLGFPRLPYAKQNYKIFGILVSEIWHRKRQISWERSCSEKSKR